MGDMSAAPHLALALSFLSFSPNDSSASIAEQYGQIYIGVEYAGVSSIWNIGPHDGEMMAIDTFGQGFARWLRVVSSVAIIT